MKSVTDITTHIADCNNSLYSKVRQVQPTLANLDSPEVAETASGLVHFPTHKSQADKLLLAWSDFLKRQPWQLFITFTFKEEIHPEAADKLFRVWVNKVNRHIYGQRWRKKPSGGIKWVRALEWQKRGVLHYHALVANTGYTEREIMANIWIRLGEDSKAGFIKIDQYDESQGGAEAYLSKYVAKGGQIDISQNFQVAPQIPDHEQRRTYEFGEVAST